jgi:ATP-dependent DNA ligase
LLPSFWQQAQPLNRTPRASKVQLYIFDILAVNGEDLRALPLSLRKTNLARQLACRPDGIYRSGRRLRIASQS